MEGLSINHHHHSNNNNNPMWVDEFLDFSPARRGSHKRSMSDSIAFLDAPMAEECRRSNSSTIGIGADGFEGLDDDQLMSMFDDDGAGGAAAAGPASNPSSPSDDDPARPRVRPKSEPEEDADGLYAAAADNSGERIADPKRIKR